MACGSNERGRAINNCLCAVSGAAIKIYSEIACFLSRSRRPASLPGISGRDQGMYRIFDTGLNRFGRFLYCTGIFFVYGINL